MTLIRRQDGAESSPGKDAATDRFSPLGIATAGSLALGVLCVMRLSGLVPVWMAGGCAVVGALLWLAPCQRIWRLVGALVFGFGWAALGAHQAMTERMPPAMAGQDWIVTGRVVGLPEQGDRLQRFDLRVDAAEGDAAVLRGARVRLRWYAPEPIVRAGDHWTLQVRLRRPRGVINPGGFDFERYALERRIAATGHVRESPANARLQTGAGIDRWRADLSERLAQSGGHGMRFLRALALGDTRGFEDRDWDVLRATGLSHLFAISGFHVGVVAGLAALLAGGLYRLWPRLGLRLPRPLGAALMALLAAVGYAAAAGFALPTQRAVLMIAAALLARILRRTSASSQAFALAVIVVLLADPLAVLGAGFWLSFVGVGWLLWCLPREGRPRYLRDLLGAQGVVTLGLLPLTVWFFGQASLVGPLLNLVAIPVVTVLIVPLALTGAAAEALRQGSGVWLLDLTADIVALCWQGADAAAAWPWAQAWLPEPTLPAFALALVGAVWLLMPRGVPARWLGLALWLPMLAPAQAGLAKGEIEVGVVDVGQGLATVIRTAGHVLVYDTGPAYAGGLDLGEAALVPALHAQGIGRIDALVVSHGDNDHAGGRHAVLRAFSPARRYAPGGWEEAGFGPCERGGGWTWDGVRFEFLHPTPHFPYLGNDASCVLRVAGPHGAVLLPGDISEVVEERLVRAEGGRLAASILIVPHHGSRTSSSPAFVGAVAPRFAVYAIGHENRFGFPRDEVLARYGSVGARREDTAAAGYLRMRLDGEGPRMAERARESRRRFWHETTR